MTKYFPKNMKISSKITHEIIFFCIFAVQKFNIKTI